MKKKYNYHQTKFITSVPDINYLPNNSGIEIAFVGRSNAGKSSALNALTRQKNLARISKTPGRTQLINLFEVTKNIRLVDLPGYNYLKTQKSIKYGWQQVLTRYLQHRKCLKGLIILMDIRHPLKDMDIQIIKWSIAINIPVFILLSKADKLSLNKQKIQVVSVNNKLKILNNNIQIETFSSFKMIGIDKLQLKLDEWFNKLNK